MPWLYSIVLSGFALAGYTAMLIWYDPLLLEPAERATWQVYGMGLSCALAAALITFFVARMAEQLRQQAQLQAQRREESLRDQQLLAVATQAAGAAHELGTPLATMSVLLKELRQEYPQPELNDDLALLQSQVQLCKESLRQLVRAAEADLDVRPEREVPLATDLGPAEVDHLELEDGQVGQPHVVRDAGVQPQ